MKATIVQVQTQKMIHNARDSRAQRSHFGHPLRNHARVQVPGYAVCQHAEGLAVRLSAMWKAVADHVEAQSAQGRSDEGRGPPLLSKMKAKEVLPKVYK